jgi:hypothetical protein
MPGRFPEVSITSLEETGPMDKEIRTPEGVDENGRMVDRVVPPAENLCGFKKVVDAMMRDALTSWTRIWEEFQGTVVTRSGFVLPQADDGFKPSCGWPEFMERMWLLKHQLDFTEKLCAGGG